MQTLSPQDDDLNLKSPPAQGLDVLVADIARHLGVEDLPPTPDGHCELLLDDNRSLSIWPRADGTGLLLLADLPLPGGVDLEAAYRAALGFCLGSASLDAPVIGRSEDGTLVLIGSLTAQGGPDEAADGISYFLENLTLAEAALAGTSAEEPAPSPSLPSDSEAEPADAVLQALAEALDLEKIEFDENGFCALQTRDGNLLLLQHSPARQRIMLLAQVSTLSPGEEDLCLQALDYNFSAMGEGEPVLGLDLGHGGLFLVTTLRTADSTVAEVEPTMELYLNRYAKFRGEILDPDYEEDQMEAEAEAEQNPGEAAWETAFAGIRV